MITIHFNRSSGFAQYRGYAASGSDSFLDVVRQMTDCGEPDGPATFTDERGMRCMTVRSIYSCARKYRPTAQDTADRKARAERAAAERPT